MNSMRGFILLNISRFNRIRKKPLVEIITFLVKRLRLIYVHARDRLKILFNKNMISDDNFFQQFKIESSLSRVRKTLNERDLKKVKIDILSYMRNRKTPVFFFQS